MTGTRVDRRGFLGAAARAGAAAGLGGLVSSCRTLRGLFTFGKPYAVPENEAAQLYAILMSEKRGDFGVRVDEHRREYLLEIKDEEGRFIYTLHASMDRLGRDTPFLKVKDGRVETEYKDPGPNGILRSLINTTYQFDSRTIQRYEVYSFSAEHYHCTDYDYMGRQASPAVHEKITEDSRHRSHAQARYEASLMNVLRLFKKQHGIPIDHDLRDFLVE